MSESPPEVPALADACWPVDTSCVTDWDAWATDPIEADPEADPPVEAVDGVPLYSEEQKARAVAFAAMTLRMLTGYRVGGCAVTVRPCRAGCTQGTWRAYPVHGGSTPWQPVSLHGTWVNIYCGHLGACVCTGVQTVELYGPPGAIVEVKIDGEALDADAYRLDPGGFLTRVDGEAWPICQDLDAPDTEDNTWAITYIPGFAVDALGAFAAGKLAGEFVRACAGAACELPRGVTSIVRNNVTITLPTGVFPGGLTGIMEVDAYIRRWNPHSLAGPSMVMSPDLHRPRAVGAWPPPVGP